MPRDPERSRSLLIPVFIEKKKLFFRWLVVQTRGHSNSNLWDLARKRPSIHHHSELKLSRFAAQIRPVPEVPGQLEIRDIAGLIKVASIVPNRCRTVCAE